MKSKAALVVVLCVVMAALPFMTPSLAYAEAPGPTNLLVGGDFEAPAPWPWQDGIGEVQVGPGWRALVPGRGAGLCPNASELRGQQGGLSLLLDAARVPG